ncbi:hypothetical protein [uncultured Sphingomonas sp.]|uniref:hypothetical protein n=1 Tax=uncultured Sphingomonas sp. TaxID=158754 RepID=UPI0025FAFBB9|nr:hypothetical protein [uncultured Sphingomonas sp.]
MVKVTSSGDQMYLQSLRVGEERHLTREIGKGFRIGGTAVVQVEPPSSAPQLAATTALARLGPDATLKDGRSAIQALTDAAKADLRRFLGAPQGIARITRDNLPAVIGHIDDLALLFEQPDRILRDGDDALLVRTVGDRTIVLRLRPQPGLLQIIALRVLQAEELAAILELPIW